MFRKVLISVLFFFSIFSKKITNYERRQSLTDDIIGSSLALGLMVYIFNKPLNMYQKKYPQSFMPSIARLFWIHPTKVYLTISGISNIAVAFCYNKIVNKVNSISPDPFRDKTTNSQKRWNFLKNGAAQLLIGLFATYACYKDL